MSESLRELLSALTPSLQKVDAYVADTYVQESVDQLDRLGVDAAKFAREHSLLLLKPDAIVARSVAPTLNWLVDNGFRVVSAFRVPVDRHLARALWYFAWNIASPNAAAWPICWSPSRMCSYSSCTHPTANCPYRCG